MRPAALIAAAILLAGILIAYRPRHPFGWGAPKPAHSSNIFDSSTVPGFNVPTTP